MKYLNLLPGFCLASQFLHGHLGICLVSQGLPRKTLAFNSPNAFPGVQPKLSKHFLSLNTEYMADIIANISFLWSVLVMPACTMSPVVQRRLLGLEPVSLMIKFKKSRLRWFGHVERQDDNHQVKHCITWEAEGIRQRGRPKRPGGIVLRMTWKV